MIGGVAEIIQRLADTINNTRRDKLEGKVLVFGGYFDLGIKTLKNVGKCSRQNTCSGTHNFPATSRESSRQGYSVRVCEMGNTLYRLDFPVKYYTRAAE